MSAAVADLCTSEATSTAGLHSKSLLQLRCENRDMNHACGCTGRHMPDSNPRQQSQTALSNFANADQLVLESDVMQSKPDLFADWTCDAMCTGVTCSDLC